VNEIRETVLRFMQNSCVSPIPTLVMLAMFAACMPATASSKTIEFSGFACSNLAALQENFRVRLRIGHVVSVDNGVEEVEDLYFFKDRTGVFTCRAECDWLVLFLSDTGGY
jgi:hypothetical protein